MHERRSDLFEYSQHTRIIAHQVAWALAEGDVLHVRTGDALGELAGDVGERHDRMPPALSRQVIDQVDDPVFEPAHAETKDNVRDQRLRGTHLGPVSAMGIRQCPLATRSASTRANVALIDGVMS